MLRSDMVLILEASKQVILLDPTILWEDQIKEASERKRPKYSKLLTEIRSTR